jgi:thioredoxin 1
MGWLEKIIGKGGALPPPQVHVVSDENFRKEVLQSPLPVLLDVWSDGCGPCQLLVPVVMDLSRRYAGRLKVAELNVARGQKTAGKLGVRGTPTVLYFHKGKVVERIVGYRAMHYHQAYLDKELLPRVERHQPERAAG